MDKTVHRYSRDDMKIIFLFSREKIALNYIWLQLRSYLVSFLFIDRKQQYVIIIIITLLSL